MGEPAKITSHWYNPDDGCKSPEGTSYDYHKISHKPGCWDNTENVNCRACGCKKADHHNTSPDNAKPLSCDPIPVDSCWVNPNGTFFPIEYAAHYRFATHYHNCEVDDLEKRGWAHISSGSIYIGRNITQAQLDTFYDLIVAYKEANDLNLKIFAANVARLMTNVE